MKGKWAAGISPRNFSWIIKDHLAVSERPGGYARSHRPVRRQEEIIWIREQGFDRVVSLLPSPHNLHSYDEAGVVAVHIPFGPHANTGDVLGEPGRTDALGATVDYGALVRAASAVATGERFTLLERLAQRIAEEVSADGRVTSVTVAVRKLRPPVPADLATAGVRITRATPRV